MPRNVRPLIVLLFIFEKKVDANEDTHTLQRLKYLNIIEENNVCIKWLIGWAASITREISLRNKKIKLTV